MNGYAQVFDNQLADRATSMLGADRRYVWVVHARSIDLRQSVAVVVPAGRESDFVLLDFVHKSVFVGDPT